MIEKIIQFNNPEEISTQSVRAAFLENGDQIYIGDIKFEVVDVDNQHKDGHILIKNSSGEVKRFLADNFVEKVIVKNEDIVEEAA